MKKILLVVLLVLLAGCAKAKDFSYGLSQMDAVNSKYNVTSDSYPADVNKIDAIMNSYKELKSLRLDSDQEAFNELVDYRLLTFESDKQFVNSLKYGDAGTTKKGFGCKIRPLIIETVKFKNESAVKGFEAISKLKDFVDKYLQNSKLANLSQKEVIFLNASFYELSKDANTDSNIINYFCPENITLELYKEGFKRTENLSDEYINGLTYERAVKLWKQINEIK